MGSNKFLTFFFFLAAGLNAVTAQRSNVYLFNLKQVTDSVFQFNDPQYLTNFNRSGYNNHPAFFGNNELVLSVKLPDMSEPDLYLFDLEKRTKTRMTSTREGEYSPFRMPNFYDFSAVRQEINGKDTVLRLWQFPVDRLTNGKPVFKYLTGIGYYQWMNSSQVAIHKNGSPNSLVIADTRTDQTVKVADNIGRCIRTLSNGNLVYVQKDNDKPWQLMEYNLYTKSHTPVSELPWNSQDFAILPDGTILMAQGSRIYKYNRYRDKDRGWIEIGDMRFYSIGNISRLAVSTDWKLAVVAD